MVGPTVARMELICTPKSSSTLMMRFLLASSSSLVAKLGRVSLSYSLSRPSVGNFHDTKGSRGLMGVERSAVLATVVPLAFSSPLAISTRMLTSFSPAAFSSSFVSGSWEGFSGCSSASLPGRSSSRNSTVCVCGSSKTCGSSLSAGLTAGFCAMSSSRAYWSWWRFSSTVNFTLRER